MTLDIEVPSESDGPASTSNPSNEGARKLCSSGRVLSENSTRKSSPTATTSGDEASKITFSAPSAEKDPAAQSSRQTVIFAKRFRIFVQ